MLPEVLQKLELISDTICDKLREFDTLVAQINPQDSSQQYESLAEVDLRGLFDNAVQESQETMEQSCRKLEPLRDKLHKKRKEVQQRENELQQLKDELSSKELEFNDASSKVTDWKNKIEGLQSSINLVKALKLLTNINFVFRGSNTKGFIQNQHTFETFSFNKADMTEEAIKENLWKMLTEISDSDDIKIDQLAEEILNAE